MATLTALSSSARTTGGTQTFTMPTGTTDATATVSVSAVSGTRPALKVFIEASWDGGTTWSTVARLPRFREVRDQAVVIPEPERLTDCRVKWTVDGVASPSFTFQVTVDTVAETRAHASGLVRSGAATLAEVYGVATAPLSFIRVAPASGDFPYTVPATVDYVAVTTTASPRTVNLPAANAVPAGWSVTVMDESGAAGTNNITVSRAGSDTINGANTVVLNANYGKTMLVSDGTSKWFKVV